MLGSSLPPFVCRRDHVLFTLFVFVCLYCSGVQHIVVCFCFVFLIKKHRSQVETILVHKILQ